MFPTPDAKELYMRLQNALQEAAMEGHREQGVSGSSSESPLSTEESKTLRGLASDLRHQLTVDVGAAQPPQLRWARPRPTLPPPPELPVSRPAGAESDVRQSSL
jgi:hypothetical protein